MGVLPALYPKELLWAFDILPAEIWDPPGEILRANAHLQATICPVVKRGLEFILKEPHLINAGYLFPHTCDSLQNLATQVKDLIGISAPIFTFYNPKGAFNNATKDYYLDLLSQFQTALEVEHGPLNPEKLRVACELGLRIDKRRIELQTARASDLLNLSNMEYFQLIRASEFMQAEAYLALLNQVQIEDKAVHPTGKRLLLSGILAPHEFTLSFLDDLDVTIIAEDLLSGSRRIPIIPLDTPESPFEYLIDHHFLLPPCSTRVSSLTERIRYLTKMIVDSKARGVLFNVVKFCEPELFDHRFLVKALKRDGIPLLSLETELQSGLSGQDKTRLEAFIEMLDDRVLL